jgi:predicted dehydrogenase
VTSARRIRLGVCGLGRAFTLMLPTLRLDPRVQLVGACDPREAARAQFARDFGVPVHADLESMLRDPAVEAVYVASPHQHHAAQVALAARHGRHVLVEKPMALTLDECDAMIAACRDAGVQLVVGHCHSFDTPYLRTRDLIASGHYGAVRMIQAINYTDFLYRPRRPEELDTAQGGGAVFSQAAHQVDIVRLLAGAPVRRVRACTGAWDPQRPTEGAYAMLIWFDGGAFASAHLQRLRSLRQRRVVRLDRRDGLAALARRLRPRTPPAGAGRQSRRRGAPEVHHHLWRSRTTRPRHWRCRCTISISAPLSCRASAPTCSRCPTASGSTATSGASTCRCPRPRCPATR